MASAIGAASALVTSSIVVSTGKEYALSQQVKLGPAEHLALYQLYIGWVPLGARVAVSTESSCA